MTLTFLPWIKRAPTYADMLRGGDGDGDAAGGRGEGEAGGEGGDESAWRVDAEDKEGGGAVAADTADTADTAGPAARGAGLSAAFTRALKWTPRALR